MTVIHPQQFTDQPLLLKTTYEGAENDHAIHCAGYLVGRIMLRLFTPQLIERLSPEKGRRIEIMDSNCPGLVLRVTEGGVRTFGVLYRVAGKGGVGGRGKPLMGPQQRFTLGKYPRIGLKQARERARREKISSRSRSYRSAQPPARDWLDQSCGDPEVC